MAASTHQGENSTTCDGGQVSNCMREHDQLDQVELVEPRCAWFPLGHPQPALRSRLFVIHERRAASMTSTSKASTNQQPISQIVKTLVAHKAILLVALAPPPAACLSFCLAAVGLFAVYRDDWVFELEGRCA
eukprot:364208-Chlamydomonas_euryale.AAC.5